MRPLLAVDSAGATCGVAVMRSPGQVSACVREARHDQARILVPMVADLLAQQGLSMADIGRVAVTVGPGSFTGLRVGIALARGLALPFGCPVLGICSFAAWRAALPDVPSLVVVLDSRRDELFVQINHQDEPFLSAPEELVLRLQGTAHRVAGDASERLTGLVDERLCPAPSEPIVVAAARLAWDMADPEDAAAKPLPVYMRPPDISRPRNVVNNGGNEPLDLCGQFA